MYYNVLLCTAIRTTMYHITMEYSGVLSTITNYTIRAPWRSLLPSSWSLEHENAWSWFWSIVEKQAASIAG